MSYQNTHFRKKANLWIRYSMKRNICLAYTPDNPTFYSLSPITGLILELCDEKPQEVIEKAFFEALGPGLSSKEAKDQLIKGLELLQSEGLIEFVT